MMDRTATSDQSLCFHRSLRRSAKQVNRLYDRALSPCGLRAVEFALLAHIKRAGSIGIVELADAFLFDRSTLRYRLAPLEAAKFVLVVPDPRDKRVRRIEITDAGSRKLAEATSLWQAAQVKFAALLNSDEAEALRAAATKVASAAFATSFVA